MVYAKKTWKEDGTTPITAQELNRMETQYDESISLMNSLGLGQQAATIWGNLNELNYTGFYKGVGGTNANEHLINAPNTFGYFLIQSIKWQEGDRWQLAFELGTGDIYSRRQSSGVWSSWKKLLFA
jgi:hypothetical protein